MHSSINLMSIVTDKWLNTVNLTILRENELGLDGFKFDCTALRATFNT